MHIQIEIEGVAFARPVLDDGRGLNRVASRLARRHGDVRFIHFERGVRRGSRRQRPRYRLPSPARSASPDAEQLVQLSRAQPLAVLVHRRRHVVSDHRAAGAHEGFDLPAFPL